MADPCRVLPNSNGKSINLPGANWCCFKIKSNKLAIVETMTSKNSARWLCIRKHVIVNQATGRCDCYVMDTKALVGILSNVEIAIELLDTLKVCDGGLPTDSASTVRQHPAEERLNVYVDSMGNWRHAKCRIIAEKDGSTCQVCQTLGCGERKMSVAQPSVKRKISKHGARRPRTKRIFVANGWRRMEIIDLRKRCLYWCRRWDAARKRIKRLEGEIARKSGKRIKPCSADGDDENDE